MTLSGQLNRAVLVAADGGGTNAFFADNDHSSTRLTGVVETGGGMTWSAGAAVEVEVNANATTEVSQRDLWGDTNSKLNERRLEVWFGMSRLGRLWIGHGPMATEDTSEVDISGTTLAGGSDIGDVAGGLFFRSGDGSLTHIRVGDAFTNLDGLGKRDRLRYDTPEIGGLTVSASVDEHQAWDVAVRSAASFGGAEIKGAAGLASGDSDRHRVNGSASLRLPSGWVATLAGGWEDVEQGRAITAVYIKTGWRGDIWAIGENAVSVDGAVVRNMETTGGIAWVAGLQAVQVVDDWATDLYVGLRFHVYDHPTRELPAVAAALLGARLRF
ncbi:hypothetical protein [Caenispirillum salinarum]|uniref:hypothetical protein n=1 Tax=Caenispirillum salinarum TaxID=859058 RepID=UPI0012671D22|nr:hypothetical protein [Caenispirillum salinarum]